MKTVTVSIIIPAYNEERDLAACLQSIARQTIPPEEVIVVDNNSTDRTVEIAQAFDFVKVLYEPEQGLIPTRNTGFAAASGDILGRINADACLDENWVARLKYQFSHKPQLAAIGGIARNRLGWGRFQVSTKLPSQVYCMHAEAYFGVPVLWGANMALRRSAWRQIARDTQLEDSMVHEDQDITLCLARNGLRIMRDNGLLMTSSEHSYYYFPKLIEYFGRRHATRRLHMEAGALGRPYVYTLSSAARLKLSLITLLPMAFFIGTSPIASMFMNNKRTWRLLFERI